MHGQLKVLKERLICDRPSRVNVSDFISKCKERLQTARNLARNSLSSAQARMKTHYDRKTVERNFQPGDEVLVLLPKLKMKNPLRPW